MRGNEYGRNGRPVTARSGDRAPLLAGRINIAERGSATLLGWTLFAAAGIGLFVLVQRQTGWTPPKG